MPEKYPCPYCKQKTADCPEGYIEEHEDENDPEAGETRWYCSNCYAEWWAYGQEHPEREKTLMISPRYPQPILKLSHKHKTFLLACYMGYSQSPPDVMFHVYRRTGAALYGWGELELREKNLIKCHIDGDLSFSYYLTEQGHEIVAAMSPHEILQAKYRLSRIGYYIAELEQDFVF